MADDTRGNDKADERNNKTEIENAQGSQPEMHVASELDLPSVQSSRRPFTCLSQEDSDLALARALQEQVIQYSFNLISFSNFQKNYFLFCFIALQDCMLHVAD